MELKTKEEADKAIRDLSGRFLLGRPVKVRPGVAGSSRKRTVSLFYAAKQEHDTPKPVFERWTRTDAPNHFQKYNDEGRRLWVGGLPPMSDHHRVNQRVRELFGGYKMFGFTNKTLVFPC